MLISLIVYCLSFFQTCLLISPVINCLTYFWIYFLILSVFVVYSVFAKYFFNTSNAYCFSGESLDKNGTPRRNSVNQLVSVYDQPNTQVGRFVYQPLIDPTSVHKKLEKLFKNFKWGKVNIGVLETCMFPYFWILFLFHVYALRNIIIIKCSAVSGTECKQT